MPRAKNLKEAYNNFYVEPLKEYHEHADFYVDRPGIISPMLDLKDRIELADSDRKEKYLFLGFRGSGKSTELYRLEAALDKSRFLEINKCKEAREEGPDSVLTRELLFSLTAVEYEDEEGRWCEINPMLLPLVKKWTQSP